MSRALPRLQPGEVQQFSTQSKQKQTDPATVDPNPSPRGDPSSPNRLHATENKDHQKRIKDAERALENNKNFRRWFHREYKWSQRTPSGEKRNPDLPGEDVLDAYEEWIDSGKPEVK